MIVRNLGNWERMTSLDRLVMLFLEQPRMLLVLTARDHSWLIFNLFTRNIRFFSAMLFFSWSPPACAGAVPPPGLHLAFAFVGLHEVSVGPFLQPIPVPLKGGTTARCIGHCFQFSTTCRFAECVLWPFVQVINRDEKPCWPQNHLLGCIFSSWFPDELHATDALLGVQRVSQSIFNTLAQVFSAWRDIRLFQCFPLYTFMSSTPHLIGF